MKTLELKKGFRAWIDEDDFERFGYRKWTLHAGGFAVRDGAPWTGKTGQVRLHRLIVGAMPLEIVDFKNNVKLDCRRANLICRPAAKGDKKRRCDEVEEFLSLIVMKFAAAFPKQTRYGLPHLRKQLREAYSGSGLSQHHFLWRLEGWAAARANIGPWLLAEGAPVLEAPDPIETPPPALPAPSVQTMARVKAVMAEWSNDGTV